MRHSFRQTDPSVTRWLYLVAVVTFCLIVAGGFVRLTRSGLSIVEWKPIVGTLPPLTDDAWRAEFEKYQQTPEYRTVNLDMTMDGYRRIFYVEWGHRLIARLAGLAVLMPLVVFLWRGVIPLRHAGPFVGVALLFGLQGFLGWFMVSSGLLDRPSVSHYRLTVHLLTALLLLAVTTWAAMNRDARIGPAAQGLGRTATSRIAIATLTAVTLQIAAGGLVAGLKAGHVSYSWPLMGDSWLPPGTFAGHETVWASLTAAPAAVHWIHRWFAFVVVALATVLLASTSRRRSASLATRRAAQLLALLVGLQVVLGISVLWFHVPITLALGHQALGLGVFLAALVACHRSRQAPDTGT